MRKKFYVALLFINVLIPSGCEKKEKQIFGNGTFIDYGFIPADVTINVEFQSMIFNDGSLFIATSDGIWKCNISDGQWLRSGLEGKNISAIFKHPEIADKFFAGVFSDYTNSYRTLFISDDGGLTWHSASNPIFNTFDNYFENYECFAVRPGHPQHLYANLTGGGMIAVSTDCGENWVRMNYEEESYASYACNIVFLPENPDVIFQGAEAPLDCAWLGRYDVNSTDPVMLNNFTTLVDMSTWSNRRPNELQTYSYTGDFIYVGQEGALSKVTGTSNKFIFKCENFGKDTNLDSEIQYTYIKGIWVDPDNTDHLLFGGALNNDIQPMQLYETYDEGETIHRYTEKFGLENPEVHEIVMTSTYPAILLNDSGANKVKVLLFKPYDKQ